MGRDFGRIAHASFLVPGRAEDHLSGYQAMVFGVPCKVIGRRRIWQVAARLLMESRRLTNGILAKR